MINRTICARQTTDFCWPIRQDWPTLSIVWHPVHCCGCVQTNQALARVGGGGSQSQVQGHVKTQLIAHDKEVYDIAFSRAGGGRDMFASVGRLCLSQGDHLYGKPGNVREFGKCQGNVRGAVNSQGNVREKSLSWKSIPKLFITRWILAFPSKTVHSFIYT